jgi:hypothetical protein
MIKLVGTKILENNQDVDPGNVSGSATIKTNYPPGANPAILKLIGAVDGELDSVESADNNDTQILPVSGAATISENIKIELTGGDNQVEATATITFTSNLTLLFTAVGLGIKGNYILIEFEEGLSRDVNTNIEADTITVVYTYLSGDGYPDMIAYFDVISYLNVIANFTDYSYSETDSLEHEGTLCERPISAMIDSTHFVLAYSGSVNCIVKTFSIDENKENIHEIDAYNYASAYPSNIGLAVIDSTHFMIAHRISTQNLLKIFSVDGETDNIAQLTSTTFESGYGYSSIVLINSSTFIIAYSGSIKCCIATYTINPDYSISLIDRLEHFSAKLAIYNSLIIAEGNKYILAYAQGSSGVYIGRVKTFSTDSNHSNITEIDSATFYAGLAGYNDIIKLTDNTYILGYTDASDNAILKLITTDSDSDNISIDDTETPDSSGAAANASLAKLDSTIFLLNYTGSDDKLKGKIYEYDGGFSLLLTFDIDDQDKTKRMIKLIQIDTYNYFVFYADIDDNGLALTYNIYDLLFNEDSENMSGGFSPEIQVTVLSINGESIFPPTQSLTLPLKAQITTNHQIKAQITEQNQLSSKLTIKNHIHSQIFPKNLESKVTKKESINARID